MGRPFTYIVYTSDSGGEYLVKQQNVLQVTAGNTKATAANQHPGLPRNILPRSCLYTNAGVTLKLVFGTAAQYAAAPATVNLDNLAWALTSKSPERVRVLRPG